MKVLLLPMAGFIGRLLMPKLNAPDPRPEEEMKLAEVGVEAMGSGAATFGGLGITLLLVKERMRVFVVISRTGA